ncbi:MULTISPECIES: phosphate ABC transporter substrate-binding protein PstS [unclassified Nocardioides]|uniref:phosphate ABC transporter substrate-binding protein PstS n=1 Tax=unclassified Nocardioides TaxID=2615069 RepID=UPI0007039E78|nr:MULTISPECIES: phosphate ABC transporter substrate-binding protein PstS [unclassified Nocardioides]KQP65637.1 phosphate ABC transporter substrate-binding protein [Nocardioides sp. Leaf285]KQQ42899.1 phosphate ABC transporter substrate-binding protein [Nocardioides sp. Leaf307]MBJ7528499.1 phosphate ABC transporter substrate-binding protein PstS [Nocardioides sp.]
MKRTSIRRVIVPGIAAMTLALAGCAAGNETDSGSTGSDGDSASSDVSVEGQYTIGGASSQEAAQLAWTTGFSDVQPGATVTYEPVGSGGGRENFISGAYLTAGSDAYLVDEAPDNELTAATERCEGEAPIEVPNYVSPIAIIFNVDGVDELNLSPETLAGIFAGEITEWNDPAIEADNPDADLPSATINPVHRSDESGTTENFTNYLSVAAGDTWTEGAVETWPQAFGGEGAQGTSGVVSAVTDGQNAIGYADASQAGDLPAANIGVGSDFVEPSAEAAANILAVSPAAEDAGENQLIFDLDYTTDEADTYPIVLTSYMIACPTYPEQADADFVKAYLSYVLSEEGQQFGADEAGVAPLAPELEEQALAIVDTITAG